MIPLFAHEVTQLDTIRKICGDDVKSGEHHFRYCSIVHDVRSPLCGSLNL